MEKNKTLVKYLDNTLAIVYEEDVPKGKITKAEVTNKFVTLFECNNIEKIEEVTPKTGDVCFVVKVKNNNNITYINMSKDDLEHYKLFHMMYQIKKDKHNIKVGNLSKFFKTLTIGAIIVSTAFCYGVWKKEYDNAIEGTMEEIYAANKLSKETGMSLLEAVEAKGNVSLPESYTRNRK